MAQEGKKNIQGSKTRDLLNGTEGNEHLKGRGGNDVLQGLGGDDKLWGNKGDDAIFGGDGNDRAWGGNGKDRLVGNDGDDTLSGGPDDDVVYGERGVDILSGGDGADTFLFGTYRFSGSGPSTVPVIYEPDSGVGEGARDIILDFVQGEDIIDLFFLNYFSVRHTVNNAEFEFLGSSPFTYGQPQLRYEIQNGNTIIQLSGAMLRDPPPGFTGMEIELFGVFELKREDFIL